MIRLWRQLGSPDGAAFALALGLGVLATVCGVLLLGTSGWFLSAAAAAGASGAVQSFNYLWPSVGVRLFAVGRVVSRYGEQLVGHRATLGGSATLRPLLFERLARARRGLAPLPAGELSALVDDVNAVEGGFLRVLAPALGVAASGLAALGWAVAAAPLAGLIFAVLFALGPGVAPLALARRAQIAAAHLAEQQADIRSEIAACVENAVELETVGRLGAQMAAGADRMARQEEALDRLQQPFRFANAGLALLSALAAIAVLAVGWTAGGDAPTAIGAALAVLAAFEGAAAVARILDAAPLGRAAARRLSAKLAIAPEPETGPVLETLLPLKLDGVTIALAGGRFIGPVSLACARGEVRVVGGRSGAGKTTLLEAIAHLRPISDGALTYGGVAAPEVRSAAVLAKAAIAPQFPGFPPGRLRDQLALGRPDASDADIAEALRIACADAFVTLDSPRDAAQFSGGEARRLALARALVAQPQLLLLDEPFEGLEPDLVDRLTQGLRAWVSAGDRAILIIDHLTDHPDVRLGDEPGADEA